MPTNQTASPTPCSGKMPKPLLPFQPFNENAPVRIYSRSFLPHWRQAGCTYFVTFRTADSIPQAVYREWQHERNLWLRAHGIDPDHSDWKERVARLPKRDQTRLRKQYAKRLFAETDKCHGMCRLKDHALAQLVANAMEFFHDERVNLGDYVIMPNHIHALLTPINGYELEKILHSIKSYTAKQINRQLGASGQFWMDDSYDHIVRDGQELCRIQEYIRTNPAKAGFQPNDLILHKATYTLT